MTTDAEQAFTQAALNARELWGQDAAKGLLVALRDAGATVGQVVEMIAHLRGLRASEGAVVAMTEQIIDGGAIPTKTEARHFVTGHAAKARREAQAQPAQIPTAPTLGAWMKHYDAFQAERAVYGRCD